MSGGERWRLPRLITERLHMAPNTPARTIALEQRDWKAARSLWQAIDSLRNASP